MAGEAGAPGSILLQNAIIDTNESLPGGHYLLRLIAPGIAVMARPGQFVHLRCGPDLPMRRPLSILQQDQAGRVYIGSGNDFANLSLAPDTEQAERQRHGAERQPVEGEQPPRSRGLRVRHFKPTLSVALYASRLRRLA